MNRNLMLCLLLACFVPTAACAREVTLALVTDEGRKSVPVEERQALWKSPYGGWVVATWPFEIRVGDATLFGYRTLDERLAAQLQPAGDGRKPAGGDVLEELTGNKRPTLRPADLTDASQVLRRSTATLDLAPGRHRLLPFGAEFTVESDGTLKSADARLRVDSKGARIELLCHPVVLKTVVGERSVEAPLSVVCGAAPLLKGLETQWAEFEAKDVASSRLAAATGFRRLTVYLPASVPGNSYAVNEAAFDLDGTGTVRLAGEGQARTANVREIRVLRPEREDVPRQTIGVQWYGAPEKGPTIRSGADEVVCREGSGSARLSVPLSGDRSVSLGAERVRLPAFDERRPHLLLLFDVEKSAAWTVEAAPLSAAPGGEWSCRIASLTRGGSVPSQPLAVHFAPFGPRPAGAAESSSSAPSASSPSADGNPAGATPTGPATATLAAVGGGVFTGKLPVAEGLWRVTVAGDSSWAGRPLGLVRISEKPLRASVSLFTVRNRGLVRRGDPLEILWSARFRDAGAARWPVVIRGRGVAAQIAELAPAPGAGGTASGSLRFDTSLLAPGEYEVAVAAPDAASHPLRFRVAQREPASDFEIYSHVYNDAKPHGGSLVTAYYGALPGGPGLAPFLADGDASFDPVFASYGSAPLGPAAEKFARPTDEERTLMALAGQGMRAVPAYPQMLHHEEWNPKHTLPEDLAQLRRRLALFVQPRADVAGLGGISLGWFAKKNGYWEESPPLDGHQPRRNAAAGLWVKERLDEELAKFRGEGLSDEQLGRVAAWRGTRLNSSVLSNAWGEYLADVRAMRPDLTAHNAIPSFDQGGVDAYAPTAYETLTHRDAVDYTDYCLPPWGNFRAPAFLGMDNRRGQKLQCEFFTHDARSEQIPVAFGAAGRGLDGISLTSAPAPLLRIFERFGSWFSAFEPLPDVAVYYVGWRERASVVLHDLARLRRPGMLLSPEDVLAGRLAGYKVLFLPGVGGNEPPAVLDAFREFAARGGVVIKDAACDPRLPGRDLGFAYDKTHVHSGWGLAWPNGEWEFAHLWQNFRQHRERPLVEAFAAAPHIPVGTPDADVVVSPLAGRESILCFVVNQTLAPLEIEGRWRQTAVLPRIGTLHVEPGWHVRDVLAGRPARVEESAQGATVPVDFTRAEGALFLLTRRAPEGMTVRSEQAAPGVVRLAVWLTDAAQRPLPDPMPFEVVLRKSDGTLLFRKYAALSESKTLDVPVPSLAGTERLELSVRDLVTGRSAVQELAPTPTDVLAARAVPDLVGGAEAVSAFFARRRGPVTILLDEGQEAFRPAAESLVALLAKAGRTATIAVLDPAEVRPLPLRWKPLPQDEPIVAGLGDGRNLAWRVGLSAVEKANTGNRRSIEFDDPKCGYDEYGPRLRLDADVVLLGTPGSHRAVAELVPYLRRVPTESHPAAGGFFVHHLWSPFQGGFHGLYLGCHDPAGAVAAVAALGDVLPPEGRAPQAPVAATARLSAPPVETRGESVEAPENLVVGKFGTGIQEVRFAPDGRRVFVATDAYGDWLFVLDAAGNIQQRFSPDPPGGFPVWWRYGRGVRPAGDDALVVRQWNAEYLFDLRRGLVGKVAAPATGFVGPFSVPVSASTKLEDPERARTFLGGARKMLALDPRGQLLWSFDDAALRTGTDDLLYPRSLFPRGVSADGRVLLVAGFGIKHDVYGRGAAVNASLLGLDTATGRRLWQREGTLLNEGKVIPAAARFLVAEDAGTLRLVDSATGNDAGLLPPVSAADWMLAVPGRDDLLIVENNAYDRTGPACRVYLRPLAGGDDRHLSVPGRVRDVSVSPDGAALAFASSRDRVLRFAPDGRLLWDVEVPAARLVRPSPDGRELLVGTHDGLVHWLDAETGTRRRSVDFNPFNLTDGTQLVARHRLSGDVPLVQGLTEPPPPLEPSYLKSLAPETATFGPNLVPAARAASDDLAPDTSLPLQVEAGRTYLVELVAAAARPDRLSPHTRLEIAVRGPRRDPAPTTGRGRPTGSLAAAPPRNLPFVGRLPLTDRPVRRRAAFRADETGTVVLAIRAVEPRNTAEPGKPPRLAYDEPDVAPAGLSVSEFVVAAMNLGARNVVHDAGAQAETRPAGNLTCLVQPWTGGNSTLRHEPYPCVDAAFRLVDGVLANQESAWTKQAKGTAVAHAEALVQFKKPQQIRSIAVYEDASGPVPHAGGVGERTALRYGVYVREARTQKWQRIGFVDRNTQLVNVFAVPKIDVDAVRYFWAGRNDAARTDGFVRAAEIEVHSADALSDLLDEVDRRRGDGP